MACMLSRKLFWQVYLTLIASLMLLAVLGAVISHVLAAWGMIGGMRPRMHFARPSGPPVLHIMAVLLVVGATVGVAAYPLVSGITRRLEALRTSVEAWDGAGGGANRAVVEGSDEIAAVARSFNRAADRAEALLAAHKALLANASHELRSPLARLRMATELLGGGDAAQHIATINREIAELDGLVEEILLASRLDRVDTLETETVDCLALVAEEAARVGLAVEAIDSGAGPFEVTGSSRLLRRLVRNLIENALKHGAPAVEIGVASAAGRVIITVRDHGAGIAPDLRERVFEPFFRPEGRAEQAGSWGLGLALARQIARRHGGEVTCGAADRGGAAFRVELPTGA
jgi:two-component system OmpR family sensor kinase